MLFPIFNFTPQNFDGQIVPVYNRCFKPVAMFIEPGVFNIQYLLAVRCKRMFLYDIVVNIICVYHGSQRLSFCPPYL